VVTTDGSITDIPRQDYLGAERRAILDMKATGKPFLVVINTRNPGSSAAKEVRSYLHDEFGVDAAIADCQALDNEEIVALLRDLLYAFPIQELQVYLPRWVDALEAGHPVKTALYEKLMECAGKIHSLAQAEAALAPLEEVAQLEDYAIRDMDLASGTVNCTIQLPESLFYEILSNKAGTSITTDGELLQLLTQWSEIKKEYDKISDALSSVKATGYGIVMPTAEEMTLQTPEVLKKNGAFGVKLRAGAPSIHMIRVDIDTEISPMVGSEQQSQDLIAYLGSEESENLWQSNIFGKSVYDMIQDGLTAKLVRLPEDVRMKFRGTLQRIVNEGAQSLICLIL
jgi:stage IV sporulation protein A